MLLNLFKFVSIDYVPREIGLLGSLGSSVLEVVFQIICHVLADLYFLFLFFHFFFFFVVNFVIH